MRKLIVFIVLAAALTATATASAAGGWWNFTNKSHNCTQAKPGGERGAGCYIHGGSLDGWSWIVAPAGIEVRNSYDRVVYKRNASYSTGDRFRPSKKWKYFNGSVACNPLQYTNLCMIFEGSLGGWSLMSADDGIEISNLDNKVVYRKGEAW